jgi:hypothetical protein
VRGELHRAAARHLRHATSTRVVPRVCTTGLHRRCLVSCLAREWSRSRAPPRVICARFCAVPLRSTSAPSPSLNVTASAARRRQPSGNASSNAVVRWVGSEDRLDDPAHGEPTKAGADTARRSARASHAALRPAAADELFARDERGTGGAWRSAARLSSSRSKRSSERADRHRRIIATDPTHSIDVTPQDDDRYLSELARRPSRTRVTD